MTLDQIPQTLQNAVIATEDERFYQHWGIDLVGVARAFMVNVVSGGLREGASTITQQLARTLFTLPLGAYARLRLLGTHTIVARFVQGLINLYH